MRRLTPREIRRIKKRGYDAERSLVKRLRRAGLNALRVPVSAPSSEPFPDVFATKGDIIMAFEVKSGHKKYDYFKEKQVKKLFGFLEVHAIYPKRFAVLAAKFPQCGWRFKVVEDPGDYVIKFGDEMTFQELLRSIKARSS